MKLFSKSLLILSAVFVMAVSSACAKDLKSIHVADSEQISAADGQADESFSADSGLLEQTGEPEPKPDAGSALMEAGTVSGGGTETPFLEIPSEGYLPEGVDLGDGYGEGTMVPCTMGLLVYYNQSDPRWGDSLYGPSDPMRSHGCGPTAVAMVVSSFTDQAVTPLDVAQWASENGYCSRGEGSLHSLIPEGLAHYGLTAEPLADHSKEAILNEIQSGKIVIALMNRGYFTNGGHFLLLTQVTEDGKLRIADPANYKNTQIIWEPDFILSQVRSRAEAGGPLWSVGMLPEE